jgi:hypothetical protein
MSEYHMRGKEGRRGEGGRLLLIHTQNDYHRQDSLDIWKKLLIVNKVSVAPASRTKYEIPAISSLVLED